MPAPIRLSRKQLAALTGQAADTAKPAQNRATKPAQRVKPLQAHKYPPTVGKRYRVAREVQTITTPPPVGMVLVVWRIAREGIYLNGDDGLTTLCPIVSEKTLRDYFEEVSAE